MAEPGEGEAMITHWRQLKREGSDERRRTARRTTAGRAAEVRGFKRIWIVFTVCWVVRWLLIPAAVILQSGPNLLRRGIGGGFFVVLLVPPALAYGFLFWLLPWIIEGFRKNRR